MASDCFCFNLNICDEFSAKSIPYCSEKRSEQFQETHLNVSISEEKCSA